MSLFLIDRDGVMARATPADVVEWITAHPEAVDALLAAIGEKRVLEWALTEPCPVGDGTCGGCEGCRILRDGPLPGRVWRRDLVYVVAHHVMVEGWKHASAAGWVSPPIDVAERTLARLLDAAEDG